MADPAADAPSKLSLADVLHRLVDLVSLHPDTAATAHQLVADNVASDQEQAAAADAKAAGNPWAGKSDEEVLDAAFAGDKSAVEEVRARRAAPAPAPVAEAAPAPDAPAGG